MSLLRGMLVVFGCVAILSAGCGGSAIQFKRVEAVKSAAIVAVAAGLNIENRNQGHGSGTAGSIQEMATMGTDEKIAERMQQGNAIYDALVAEIAKSQGWAVKARDEVVAPSRVPLKGARRFDWSWRLVKGLTTAFSLQPRRSSTVSRSNSTI